MVRSQIKQNPSIAFNCYNLESPVVVAVLEVVAEVSKVWPAVRCVAIICLLHCRPSDDASFIFHAILVRSFQHALKNLVHSTEQS